MLCWELRIWKGLSPCVTLKAWKPSLGHTIKVLEASAWAVLNELHKLGQPHGGTGHQVPELSVKWNHNLHFIVLSICHFDNIWGLYLYTYESGGGSDLPIAVVWRGTRAHSLSKTGWFRQSPAEMLPPASEWACLYLAQLSGCCTVPWRYSLK